MLHDYEYKLRSHLKTIISTQEIKSFYGSHG